MGGRIVAVCVSDEKGMAKRPVACARLVPDHGITGDAHAGARYRQVSLLAMESIQKIRRLGLDVDPGRFAENITTEGIDLVALPVGTRLRVGQSLLAITQIGKECHSPCAIFHQAGDCVMPREGVFARVEQGGVIRAGDPVTAVTGQGA